MHCNVCGVPQVETVVFVKVCVCVGDSQAVRQILFVRRSAVAPPRVCTSPAASHGVTMSRHCCPAGHRATAHVSRGSHWFGGWRRCGLHGCTTPLRPKMSVPRAQGAARRCRVRRCDLAAGHIASRVLRFVVAVLGVCDDVVGMLAPRRDVQRYARRALCIRKHLFRSSAGNASLPGRGVLPRMAL